MPDGTIQDSRNPYSPQWGYLKVRDPRELKSDDPNQNDDWNEYILFIDDKDPNPGNQHKKYIKFDMKNAELKVDGVEEKVKIRVAKLR